MTRRPFISLFVLAVMILLVPGCRKDTGDQAANRSEPAKTGKLIGVTLLNVQDRFYQDLRDGLLDEADKLGMQVRLTTAERDSAVQANQIDEFIAAGVDAIVISPCDSRSVGTSIVEANEANIPVFTADIANMSSLGTVVSHIASDNVAGGRAAANLMIKAIEGKGKVAVLTHPEVSSVMDRVAGFRETIGEHPGIEIAVELSSDGKREKAAAVMEDLLQSHPDINGVFGINDATALGALASVESAGRLGAIQIVGYDATPEARSKIKAGALYGDVIQNPELIGRLTVRAIRDHFEGKDVPPMIPVKVGTFTGTSE